MIQRTLSKPSVDPRQAIERDGVDALAQLLAGAGYIIQRCALIDLAHALRSRKPLLVEGPRGGGKTALAESLALACNLTSFYLQGMDDLTICVRSWSLYTTDALSDGQAVYTSKSESDHLLSLLPPIERQTEEHIAKGMTPEEARYAALWAIRGVEQRKEECRDMRRVRLIEELMQDLRYGLRTLRKNPGFTAVAVLTLALGIGVNTSLFTLFNAVALRPLPVKDPERIVKIYRERGGDSSLGITGSSSNLSYPEYITHRDSAQAFAGLTAYAGASLTLSGAEAEGVRGLLVAGNYFSVLGAEMALGRAFAPEECQTPGAAPVVVLSHSFWGRRFGADPSLVGKTLTLNRQPFTVIGVTSPDFHGAELKPPDMWAPLTMQVQLIPGGDFLPQQNLGWLDVVGRLKPGVSPAQAQAEMMLLTRQLDLAYPGRKTQIVVVPGNFLSNPRQRNMAFGVTALLMAAVGLALLIACANVANLSLARAATRQKEIAVRLALGASRLRLVRQLLTESVLIAFMGGVGGLLAGYWTMSALIGIGELHQHLSSLNLSPDIRVFSYTLLVSLVTGVTFGLAPALQTTKPNLASALKDEGAAFGQGLSRSRLRDLLIVAQVTVCLALLITAGLLARGLQNAQTIDPGFETQRSRPWRDL